MKSWIFDKILINRRGDGGNIANVFHHGCECDRGHDQNGGQIEFAEGKCRYADPGSVCDVGKRKNGGAVCVCHAHGVEDQCGNIRNNDAHQNRDDLKHSPAPDIENNDRNQSDEGEKPVGGSVVDGRTGKAQSDADDDRTGYDRRKKTHDLLDTDKLDNQRENQI